jgi:hypothetical protein
MLFAPNSSKTWYMLIITLAVLVVGVVIAAAAWRSSMGQQRGQVGPGSKQPGGPAPSRVLAERTLHKPPPLSGQGDEARRAAEVFINWAGKSTVREREDGRKAIAAARDNKDIAVAFCEQAFTAQKTDNSRALLVLSIIGELRSPYGEDCLRRFANQPLPTRGTIVEGQIIEQVALATLQAKAIDGLAYIGTKTGDAEVLKAVAKHPSIIVRAEAINAYLWNHQNSQDARATLKKYVRKGEEIYLDRVRREENDTANTFNPKLERYLHEHPEVIPPAPKRGTRNGEGRDVGKKRTASPPKF